MVKKKSTKKVTFTNTIIEFVDPDELYYPITKGFKPIMSMIALKKLKPVRRVKYIKFINFLKLIYNLKTDQVKEFIVNNIKNLEELKTILYGIDVSRDITKYKESLNYSDEYTMLNDILKWHSLKSSFIPIIIIKYNQRYNLPVDDDN